MFIILLKDGRGHSERLKTLEETRIGHLTSWICPYLNLGTDSCEVIFHPPIGTAIDASVVAGDVSLSASFRLIVSLSLSLSLSLASFFVSTVSELIPLCQHFFFGLFFWFVLFGFVFVFLAAVGI